MKSVSTTRCRKSKYDPYLLFAEFIKTQLKQSQNDEPNDAPVVHADCGFGECK